MNEVDKYLDILKTMLVEYGPKVLGAVLVLIIGLKVISKASKTLIKIFNNRNIEPTLIPFLNSVINIGLKILLLISVMSMIGIEMTSFIALLGAAGLAIGMALSGTLQNFAGGVIILLFKPYKVDDFIEFNGFMGTVKEIQIFSTNILTVDNKRVIIPNNNISSSSLINYSSEDKRRVDITFGISYTNSIDEARKVILEEVNKLPEVLNEPEAFVVVSSLGDSSVNLGLRVWVNTEHYWPIYYKLIENIKKAFDANHINIPFPQQVIHISK